MRRNKIIREETAKIAFIGFGGLGKEIEDMLGISEKKCNQIYFDDKLFDEGYPNSFPISDFSKDDFANYDFFVCLGYRHLLKKRKIISELIRLNRHLPSIIHGTSFFNSTATLGHGSVIYPMSNIDKDVRIGSGVVLHNSVTISHHGILHDCCHLGPGVTVCGYVEIDESTFVGAGSVISNGIRIGRNVIIGVGTVVTQDISDNASVIGNPMRILTKKIVLR